jgi:site-specific recombinase XerD
MYAEISQFKVWLEGQYPNSSAGKHQLNDLRLFFSWAEQPPLAITPQIVDGYIQHCLAKPLSPRTINRRLSTLRLFYYFLAIVNDESVQCPVIAKRHFLRKPQSLPRSASEEQIRILFEHIHDPRDKAMFTLMLECGLRVGEVRSLSQEDVLLEDDPPRLVIRGKGDKQRSVYLPPPALSALNDWLSSRPVNSDRAVFISKRGRRLSVCGIQFVLEEYCRAAGVQITCHQLRHAFSTRMARAKLPLASLQALLGHESPRTTQVYVDLSDVNLQEDYDCAIALIEGRLA